MNISFFGLGYVGCVGMGCLAQNGHKVIGIDISSEKIKKINEGMPTNCRGRYRRNNQGTASARKNQSYTRLHGGCERK